MTAVDMDTLLKYCMTVFILIQFAKCSPSIILNAKKYEFYNKHKFINNNDIALNVYIHINVVALLERDPHTHA